MIANFMIANSIKVAGVVLSGHRVASQVSEHYPLGTIEMQLPFFRERGLDLSAYFRGTLNLSIRPKTFRLAHPQFTFRQVEWTTQHPPEDFSFSRCAIFFDDKEFDAWIYYPHPETKERHFQDASVIEVISSHIPGIAYGSQLEIALNPDEVVIE